MKLPTLRLTNPREWMNPSYKKRSNRILNESPRHAILQDLQAKATRNVIETAAGRIVFENGIAVLPNDTRADDVKAELAETRGLHPGHYILHKGQRNKFRDGVHHYTFGVWPGAPWHEHDLTGKVIK